MIDSASLAFYSDLENSWICEAGKFEVLVGSYSKDIRLFKNIEIEEGFNL